MTTVQYSTSTTASTILCSVLIFLFFIQIQAQNDKQASCSSSCGEIRNISYPFRLKGDPSSCGDHDYELSCVNNKTILDVFPGRFYVKNISYDDQIVRLVDTNFANGSCSLPSGSIENADGYIRDSRYRGFVSNLQSRFRFWKCSKNIIRPDNYTSVPCLTTNGTYFYTTYDGDYLFQNNETSCSLVSVAPVNPPKGVTKFASHEAVMELLEAGFDVGWSIVCRDCSLSGKSCVVKSWDKPLTYICQKGQLIFILIYLTIY